MLATAETTPAGCVRLINTASEAARAGRIGLDDLDNQRGAWLGGWRAYSNAKLANILVTRELAKRLQGTGVSAYAFHPGFVRTSFGAGNWAMSVLQFVTQGHYGISAEQGADPLIRLAATAEVDWPSGTYFDRLHPNGRTAEQADDAAFASEFWRRSEQRTPITPQQP